MLLPPGGRSAGRRRVAVAFTGLKACGGGLPKKDATFWLAASDFPLRMRIRTGTLMVRSGSAGHMGAAAPRITAARTLGSAPPCEPRLDWPRQGVRERLLPVPRDLGSTPTKSSRALDRIPIVINPFRFSLSAGKHRAGWFYWGVLVIAVDVPAI